MPFNKRLLIGCVWASLTSVSAAPPEALFIPESPPAVPLQSLSVSLTEQEVTEQMEYAAMKKVMQDDRESAVPLLREVIERDPGRFSAWEALGWVYWALDRKDETRVLWNRLRASSPPDPRINNLLASYHIGTDDLAAAAKLLEESLRLEPDQPDTRFTLAQVYRWQGFLDPSIALLAPLWRMESEREDVTLELARAYSSNWQYTEALPLWMKLQAQHPDDVERRAQLAACLLHTGDPMAAGRMAERVLEQEADHVLALQVLADRAEFSDDPRDAVPWLQRLIRSAESEEHRQFYRTRLGLLAARLHARYPEDRWLNVALEMARVRWAGEPDNVDARLHVAELLLAQGRYRAAERAFIGVLKDVNPRNLRALRGLLEAEMSIGRWRHARMTLEEIREFNPQDPYLHFYEARLEARQGRYPAAYRALDQLEAAGRQGAAAVLLYHALGKSPYGQAPSQDELREQLTALRRAGYVFMTPREMQNYFNRQRSRSNFLREEESVRRVAVVTFDDALVTAQVHGTPVARELGISFAQHIIVHNTEREDPYLTPWEALRAYARGGEWVFGSHSYYAHVAMPTSESDADEEGSDLAYGVPAVREAPIDEVARRAYPLGNRIWIPDAARLETREEFIARLHREYGHSQRVLTEQMGVRPDFFAYPFGEIGQEAASNELEAIDLNKKIARQYYDIGFLQSSFGHAVAGDDPLLYQRYEMPLRASGEDTARFFLLRHPVYLAQRTRLTFAVEEGNFRLAEDSLAHMRSSGYPEAFDDDLDELLRRNWVMKLPRSDRLLQEGEPFEWAPGNPLIGVRISALEDNLDSEYRRFLAHAGLNLAANVTLTARAGAGQYEYRPSEAEGQTEPRLRVDETYASVQWAALLENGIAVEGEVGARSLGGDASGAEPLWALQAHGRLTPISEWQIRYERDVLPGARTMVAGVTTDDIVARTVWDIDERTDLWLAAQYVRYSDGNSRHHFDIHPLRRIGYGGLRGGVRYSYWSSREEAATYWTPYESHNVYAELSWRGSRPGLYYSLDARVGIGREGVRAAPDAADGETKNNAEVVAGCYGFVTYQFTRSSSIQFEAGYFRSPSYSETRGQIGLDRRF